MQFRLPFYLLLPALLFFVACEEEPDNFSTELGYEYYPLEVGQTRVYQVDSIVYDLATGGISADSSSSFIREIVTEVRENEQGDSVYTVERTYRDSVGNPWQPLKVFTETVERRQNRIVRTEDNLQFIQMVFPVRENRDWDGNVFFDEFLTVEVGGESVEMFKGWEYEYERTDLDTSFAGTNYAEVVHLIKADTDPFNLIETRQADDYYAPGIGLIARDLEILDTQCEACCNFDNVLCLELPWSQKAERGFVLRQRLVE